MSIELVKAEALAAAEAAAASDATTKANAAQSAAISAAASDATTKADAAASAGVAAASAALAAAGEYTDDEVDGLRQEVAGQYAPINSASVLAGGATFAAIGDSITAEQYSWSEMLPFLGAGFRRIYEGATAGHTVAQVRTAHKDAVIALSPKPEYCFVFAGTNDLGAVSTGLSNLATLAGEFDAAGITPVLVLIPPRADSQKDEVYQWNAGVEYLSDINGWPTFDAFTPMHDTSTGGPIAAQAYDDVHPNITGHRAIALHNLTSPKFMSQFSRPRTVFVQRLAADGVNMIASDAGLFAVDANADGVSDGWTSVNTTGTTFSRYQADDGTWWQRIAVTNTSVSPRIQTGFITTDVAVGGVYELTALGKTEDALLLPLQLSLKFLSAGFATLLNSISNGVVTAGEGPLFVRATAPADTTQIRADVQVSGSHAASYAADVARVTLRRVA